MIIGSSIFSNKNVLLKLINDYLTLLKIYLIHQSVFTHIYGGGIKLPLEWKFGKNPSLQNMHA